MKRKGDKKIEYKSSKEHSTSKNESKKRLEKL